MAAKYKRKMGIEFEGFDEMVKRLTDLEGDVKGLTDKALKETHKMVTKALEESVQKQNLPAKGRYSKGKTERSLYQDDKVTWAGTLASIDVGFSIRKGGLASIFMIYGTPKHMKNQKMYNAIWGNKMHKDILKLQEDIFYEELRRLNG